MAARALEGDAVAAAADAGAGDVALVAAVDPDSGLQAAELIADAVKTIGGGGGKGSELAMAGGREPGRIGEALDQVRSLLS